MASSEFQSAAVLDRNFDKTAVSDYKKIILNGDCNSIRYHVK